MSDSIIIPEGFTLFPKDNTFDDAIAPVVYRMDEQGVTCAMYVTQAHCNMMGMCHGGALMTLMDFALSFAVCHKLGSFAGTPSISLTYDFLDKAMPGQWVYAEVEALHLSNTIGFARGVIKCEKGNNLVRASGNFKLPKKHYPQGKTVEEVLAQNAEKKAEV